MSYLQQQREVSIIPVFASYILLNMIDAACRWAEASGTEGVLGAIRGQAELGHSLCFSQLAVVLLQRNSRTSSAAVTVL